MSLDEGNNALFYIGDGKCFNVFKDNGYINMSFRRCEVGKNGQLCVKPFERGWFTELPETGVKIIMPQYEKLLTDADKIQEALNDSVSLKNVIFDFTYSLTGIVEKVQFSDHKLLCLRRGRHFAILTPSQFQKWRECIGKVEETLKKLRQEKAAYIDKFYKPLIIDESKNFTDECEELYLSVCGAYLRHEAIEKLVCDGCEFNHGSQHRHECMMVSESSRIQPLLYNEMNKFSDNFLKIRDIFVQVAVDFIPGALVRAIKLLPSLEKIYLYDDERGHEKIIEAATTISSILNKFETDDKNEMIMMIQSKI